jgi:hypothetical protein
MGRKSLTENHNYFSTITENSAYWTGFLAADGCIYKDSVKIALAEKDKHHLEQLKIDLKSNIKLIKNISKNSQRNINWKDSICYHVSIRSKQIVNDLKELGIEPQKTLTANFSEMMIDSPYLNAYCRGYFDGDGCWTIHNPTTRKSNPQLKFSLRGSEQFLRTFNDVLVKNANLPDRCYDKKVIDNKSKIGNLQYVGNNICTNIARWLYNDVSINSRFLSRKYDLVKLLISL